MACEERASRGWARESRGTEIVLHLKDDAKQYLEPHVIERVVKIYSDHISFPIELVDTIDRAIFWHHRAADARESCVEIDDVHDFVADAPGRDPAWPTDDERRPK